MRDRMCLNADGAEEGTTKQVFEESTHVLVSALALSAFLLFPASANRIRRSAAVKRFSASSSRFMLDRQWPKFSLRGTLWQNPFASRPGLVPPTPCSAMSSSCRSNSVMHSAASEDVSWLCNDEQASVLPAAKRSKRERKGHDGVAVT